MTTALTRAQLHEAVERAVLYLSAASFASADTRTNLDGDTTYTVTIATESGTRSATKPGAISAIRWIDDVVEELSGHGIHIHGLHINVTLPTYTYGTVTPAGGTV